MIDADFDDALVDVDVEEVGLAEDLHKDAGVAEQVETGDVVKFGEEGAVAANLHRESAVVTQRPASNLHKPSFLQSLRR